MRAWPWIVGGGALAYALTRAAARASIAPSVAGAPLAGPLPGRWVWPVPRWNGRAPVISDGFDSPRPGGIAPRRRRHHVRARCRAITFKPGTPNGSKQHVMPDGVVAVAASDGVVWSAMQDAARLRGRDRSRADARSRRSTRTSRSCS